ncbi:hypothetical protein C8R44DRAFT_740731 [Mycena epipterygia]|nr:hypothetical protein C8R44DRAFT_740731 [Mycena epipterygia]
MRTHVVVFASEGVGFDRPDLGDSALGLGLDTRSEARQWFTMLPSFGGGFGLRMSRDCGSDAGCPKGNFFLSNHQILPNYTVHLSVDSVRDARKILPARMSNANLTGPQLSSCFPGSKQETDQERKKRPSRGTLIHGTRKPICYNPGPNGVILAEGNAGLTMIDVQTSLIAPG